jgi:hypothetical protein
MKSLSFSFLLGAALLVAQSAGAFTLESRTPVNPDGSAKFVDPDQQVEKLAGGASNGAAPGSRTFRSGNMTFSFGVTRDERPTFGRTAPFGNFGFNRGFRGFNSDQ